MSYHKVVYVGPFVECKVKVKIVDGQYLTCQSVYCSNYNRKDLKGNCCNECGIEFSTKTKIKEQPAVRYNDIAELINESLFCANNWLEFNESITSESHIWVPNTDLPGVIHFIHDSDNCFNKIGVPDIEAQINILRNNFEKEISILKEKYGKENVTLCWGVFTGHC